VVTLGVNTADLPFATPRQLSVVAVIAEGADGTEISQREQTEIKPVMFWEAIWLTSAGAARASTEWGEALDEGA
jgi:hypothetical protein